MGNSRMLLGVVLASVLALVTTRAPASEEFPAAIREAAGMPCTPSCVICHGVDPGTSTTYTTRKLGLSMLSHGARRHDTAKLKDAYAAYAATGKPTATGPGEPWAAKVDADLKRGLDPETGHDVCIPTYGCGAHVVSHAPPQDTRSAVWIASALALGALVRRRIAAAG
jgi:hypothetical protein